MDYSSQQEQNGGIIETDDKDHWIYNKENPLSLIKLKREEFIDQTPFKSLNVHKVNDESYQASNSLNNSQINDQEIVQDICSKKIKCGKQQKQESASFRIKDFIFLNDSEEAKEAKMHKLTVKTILNTQFSDDVKRIIYEKHFNFAKNTTDKITMEKEQTKQAIKIIQQFLEGRPKQGKTMDQTVIWIYSTDTFLYKSYNTFFKSKHQPSELFYLLPFTKAFFKAIKRISKRQREKNQKNNKQYPRKFTCFRGAHMSKEQVLNLQNNKGGVIQNLGLLSTSKHQQIAAHFATTTIIQIIVKDVKRDKKTDNGYIYIQKMSAHESQQQILFNMLNSFRIKQVQLNSQTGGKYHRIKLEYGTAAQLISNMNQTTNPNMKEITDSDYLVLKQLTNQSIDANNFIQGLIPISAGVDSKESQDYFNKLRQLVVHNFSTSSDKKRLQLLLTNIDTHLKYISLIRQGNFTQTRNYLLFSPQTHDIQPLPITNTSASMILMKQRSNWVDKKYDKFIIDYIAETIKQLQQINFQGCVSILIKYERILNEWINKSNKCIEEQQWQHQLTCCFKLLRFIFNVDDMTFERDVKQVFIEMEKIDFDKLYQDKSILQRVIKKQKSKYCERQNKKDYRLWLEQRKRCLEEPLPQSLISILRERNHEKSKQKTNQQHLITQLQSASLRKQEKLKLERQCLKMCQKIIKVFHGLEEKCKKQTGMQVHNEMKRLLNSAFALGDRQNSGGNMLVNAVSGFSFFMQIGQKLLQQPTKITKINQITKFFINLVNAQKHYSTTFYSVYVKCLDQFSNIQQNEQESDSEISSSDEDEDEKKKNKKIKKNKKKQKQKLKKKKQKKQKN